MATAKQKEMDKIQKEIREIKKQLSELAAHTGDAAAHKTLNTLDGMAADLEALKDSVVEEITEAGTRIDDYARENHWRISAIAAIAGLISGFILAKKKDR